MARIRASIASKLDGRAVRVANSGVRGVLARLDGRIVVEREGEEPRDPAPRPGPATPGPVIRSVTWLRYPVRDPVP